MKHVGKQAGTYLWTKWNSGLCDAMIGMSYRDVYNIIVMVILFLLRQINHSTITYTMP